MKKGFTIIEVSILFVIFLIVAFLVAPLSLDDTVRTANISKWRAVQSDFANLFFAINASRQEDNEPFESVFDSVFKNEVTELVEPYKITFLNGTFPSNTYRFNEYKLTTQKAIIAYKLFENSNDDGLKGILMYDVNGVKGPNVWGRDVFGLNIYEDKFEPFCKADSLSAQKQDCSKNGLGLCCSNYYLNGGSFD